MHRFHLSLGSNVEPERHLRAALRELRARFGDLQVSSVYESAAVGFDGPPFWNLAVALESDLPPDQLDEWLHDLEAREGRRRDVPRYSDRTLDIDVVAIDGRSLERPELREAFVLVPLGEIAPDIRVPGENATIGELGARFEQVGSVELRKLAIGLD